MIRKHSATLHGHRTSFSLEDAFWQELKEIADSEMWKAGTVVRSLRPERAAKSKG